MVIKHIFTPFARQCFVSAAVCCSVVGQGCILGFAGVLLPQLQQPDSHINVTKDEASWIAAVISFAMFFGFFLIPPVMGRAGRKAAHYVVILVMLLGWLTVALANNFQGLLIGEIVLGLAHGLFMPLRSILIGEYTSPRHRGGFLTIIALTKNFGILFVHLIGSVTSYKITALVSMAFSIISLIITVCSPESPSWLATQGNYEECREAFIWLRGLDENSEFDEMIEASKRLNDQQIKHLNRIQEIGAVVKKKEFYKPIALMFILYIMMTFAGGMLMASYAVTVLNLLMGPDIQAHLWMVALDAQKFFFNVVAIYVINRFKRRMMMFSTGVICFGSLVAMAGYVFLKSRHLLPWDSLWIPGILINLQTFSIAMGMSPLTSVIAGEVFPSQYRGLAGSISLVSCSGSMFVVLKTFPLLISVIGFDGTFIIYAGVVAACLAIAWFLLPETSGRTLQQIKEYFRGKPFSDPKADVEGTSL